MIPNHPESLFTDSEVIDLCRSIIDTHRVLKTLYQFRGDLEDPVSTCTEIIRNEYLSTGLHALTERFLIDQNLKLTRIMEIYKEETDKLVKRITEKG